MMSRNVFTRRILPRSFYLNLVIRMALFSVTALAFAIGLVNVSQEYLVITVNLAILLVLQSFLIYRYIARIDKDLVRFFNAVRHNEFTDSVISGSGEKGYERFRKILGEINELIRHKSSELHARDIMFRELINISPGALIIFDNTGSIEHINRAALRILGVTNIRDVRSLNEVSAGLGDAIMGMDSTVPMRKSFSLGRGSLTKTQLSLLVQKETFTSGEKELNIVSLQDLRTVEINQEIESWQRIIRVIRHEIMNSLSPVSALTKTIRQQITGDGGKLISAADVSDELLTRILSGLNTIEDSNRSLLNFINRYRQLSSIPQPVKKQLDLTGVINECLATFSSQEHPDNIMLDFIPGEGEITVKLDPDLFKMALHNVVKNAKEAAEESGDPVIRLVVERKEQFVSIAVSDNGKGIPGEAVENIFVPFYTTRDAGSGIGLSISRQIIVMHNGRLDLTATGERGTTFTISLPVL